MSADTWTAVFAGATALFTGAIAATGAWALIYAKRQLKQAHEAEMVHHLVRFIEQFESEPIVTYRRVTAEKRVKGTHYPVEAQNILNFFETIGLLVRRQYLDLEDVWSSFGYWMFNVHADLRDDIEQEQRDDASYYRDFCDLIERLREVEQEHGGSDDRPSRDEVLEFWRDEAKIGPGAPTRKRKVKATAKNTNQKQLDSGSGAPPAATASAT
jgi:hypothetical protein